MKNVRVNLVVLFFNTSEKFRRQYAEFMRELFEMGIPFIYGSDSHNEFGICHREAEQLLASVGFVEGDLSEIKDINLW